MAISDKPLPIKEEGKKKGWIDLINESVHTSDDEDIGDIEAISRDFIVAKRGIVNVHFYYVPITKVEGWDGHVIWLKVTEDEVKKQYERDVTPDPSRYYLRDFPGYSAVFPEVEDYVKKVSSSIHSKAYSFGRFSCLSL